jgi:AcrR family transcriptional regulator
VISTAGVGAAAPAGRSARADAIVAAALQILESEGREALTMRRLADAVGIRAPSLYKHFPDKAAVELVLIEHGFTLAANAFEDAVAREGATGSDNRRCRGACGGAVVAGAATAGPGAGGLCLRAWHVHA